MAQWRCNLRISWQTQLISLLIHGVLMLLILLLPWPASYGQVWLLPLILVVFECVRSQKRITSTRGALRLLEQQRLEWCDQQWKILKKPWMPRFGILLQLQQVNGKKRQRLWLAADSMSKTEWRHLRQQLLYPHTVANEEP